MQKKADLVARANIHGLPLITLPCLSNKFPTLRDLHFSNSQEYRAAKRLRHSWSDLVIKSHLQNSYTHKWKRPSIRLLREKDEVVFPTSITNGEKMKTRYISTALAAALISGCVTNYGGPIADIENSGDPISDVLNKYCKIENPDPTKRIARGYLVLAAVAGYGIRSIKNYSSAYEAAPQAAKLGTRINEAWTALAEADAAKEAGIFPLNRADAIVEIAEAAATAIEPTFKAANKAILGSVFDRTTFAKNAMEGIIANAVYKEAFHDACTDIDKIKVDDIKARITNKCKAINSLAGRTGICPKNSTP